MKLTKSMKVMGITFGLSVMLAGCNQETEATSKVNETVEEAKSEESEMVRLRPVAEDASIGAVKDYDLSSFFQHKVAMIGPEHMVDEQIIYTDSVGEVGHEIYVYDTEQATNWSLHETSRTIGNLVGIKDEIYWIEYELTEDNGYAWSIFRMKLDASELTELYNGVSMFETPVPHLNASDDRVTWVDYEASETMTTSAVMQYLYDTATVETIQTYTLKEGEKRDGDYVFDYRVSEDGVIVHRSSFADGEKTTKLTTLDGTFDEDMGALVDFETGADYVALGKEGRADFVRLTGGAKQFQHKSTQSKITFDSFRFLPGQRILFREGMNRLLVADLNESTVSYLPSRGGTTSKPIYRDGQIAYAELGDGGLITFYTIDVN
ncbi:hypothetical protein [Exiguobacterium aurantiacum]|uniref:Lipoprotein n=1 Tax=Exiguobacterium aurantiacum TaxID=33987 RepID=A0ABY5FKS2_9BACL|nr:hypothetical protein [Exiguobacterium aurantiacum]UTT42004.1 hypothetical protein NMQ00_10580 [Exiguobacterium aurantiacum]